MTIALLIFMLLLWTAGVWYLFANLTVSLKKKDMFVPFIPSDARGVTAMADAVGLQGNERIVDIGSGSGTILFSLAKKFPNLQMTGIEMNSFLHVWAKLRKFFFFRRAAITLHCGDAQNFNYGEYDVIFLFMLSSFVDGILVPKFNEELRTGTKVVSYVFKMKSADFDEQEIDLGGKGWMNKVYVYTKR